MKSTGEALGLGNRHQIHLEGFLHLQVAVVDGRLHIVLRNGLLKHILYNIVLIANENVEGVALQIAVGQSIKGICRFGTVGLFTRGVRANGTLVGIGASGKSRNRQQNQQTSYPTQECFLHINTSANHVIGRNPTGLGHLTNALAEFRQCVHNYDSTIDVFCICQLFHYILQKSHSCDILNHKSQFL